MSDKLQEWLSYLFTALPSGCIHTRLGAATMRSARR